MTLAEAADRLGVTPATLRHQIRNGSLEATKIGRDWMVEDGEVERYAEDSRGRPGRRPKNAPKGTKGPRPVAGQLPLPLTTDDLS